MPMCFAKMPDPKPAPLPPDKNAANFDAAQEMRRAAASSEGRRSTLLSKVSNEDFASVGSKKKLGGGE